MDQSGNAQSASRCCNLDYLLINLGRNEVAAKRLVRLFVDNYPNLLQRLDEALDPLDLPALQRAVHDIRGHCVLFSAHECLGFARKIDNFLANQGAFSVNASAQIDCIAESGKLRLALARVLAELRRYLGEAKQADQADR